MAASGNRYFAAWAAAVRARASRPLHGGGLRLAWGLFILLGIPLALMTALNLIALAGLYVELLRALWLPWPSDLMKSFIGIAGFAASLAYLTYRKGKAAGYKSGAVAATAAARNLAEGRGAEAVPMPPPDVQAPEQYPPTPPL